MAVNEVTMNGETVISLVNDTVSEASLLSGETAHDASGVQITGKAKYINPNLIINPDFSINQRGKSEYRGGETGNGYTVDNWFQYPFHCNIKTNGDSGIILTNTSETENSYSDVRQSFENPLYEGQLYTLSIKIDGNVYTVTRSLTSSLASNRITDSINVYLSIDAIIIRNYMPAGSINIEWVKLEIGAVATPFVKPDRATELLKCQRYYTQLFAINEWPVQYISTGMAVLTNKLLFLVSLPTTMRLVSPSITLNGDLYISDNTHVGSNSYAASNVEATFLNGNILELAVTVSDDITLDRSIPYALSRRHTTTSLGVSAEL